MTPFALTNLLRRTHVQPDKNVKLILTCSNDLLEVVKREIKPKALSKLEKVEPLILRAPAPAPASEVATSPDDGDGGVEETKGGDGKREGQPSGVASAVSFRNFTSQNRHFADTILNSSINK